MYDADFSLPKYLCESTQALRGQEQPERRLWHKYGPCLKYYLNGGNILATGAFSPSARAMSQPSKQASGASDDTVVSREESLLTELMENWVC
jgi:hypothetical protein